MTQFSKPIIGVLGGLGPETTAEFYKELIASTRGQTRPAVCIWSLPIDRRKEAMFIASGQHGDHFRTLMVDGTKRLVSAGATTIVIPCNTVHEFFNEVSASVSVPFTNMIDLVAEEVARRQWKHALFLATSRTIQTRPFQRSIPTTKTELLLPSPSDQQMLDRTIQGLLKNDRDMHHKQFLRHLMTQAKTDHVILGCTDLQLLWTAKDSVIDSMHLLAQDTARIASTR